MKTIEDWDRERLDSVLVPYKNRVVDRTRRVRVYRNLNPKRPNYSIVQDGLVVAHADQIIINKVQFVVSEKGRQRVLATRRKNVHAYAEGFLRGSACGYSVTEPEDTTKRFGMKVTYDPYIAPHFYASDPDRPQRQAGAALLNRHGVQTCY